MHNLAFHQNKYPGVYIPLEVKETGSFLRKALLQMNLGGLSVTIPHKIWAYQMADRSDRLSQVCGASNTILFHHKRGRTELEARNSDGPGAIQALKDQTSIKGKTVLICGYGGSARAIAAQLLLSERPGEVYITGRNPGKIKAFIRDLKKQFRNAELYALTGDATALPATDSQGSGFRKSSSKAGASRSPKSDKRKSTPASATSAVVAKQGRLPDIIIQTTPLGMSGTGKNHRGGAGNAKINIEPELPLSPELIGPNTTVFDIVYNPMETPLIALARKKKCKVVYGYSMLLYQAVFQFRWFTGLEPPVEKWRKLLVNDLKQKAKS
tara:strand:- start:73411 stop:74385 length:975 start_codon:yes stop_codon:yes gene_type:complete